MDYTLLLPYFLIYLWKLECQQPHVILCPFSIVPLDATLKQLLPSNRLTSIGSKKPLQLGSKEGLMVEPHLINSSFFF
jgi:hypothetical protein